MSSFHSPPTIEELSELAWKRIETKVLDDLAAEDAPSRTAVPKSQSRRFAFLAAVRVIPLRKLTLMGVAVLVAAVIVFFVSTRSTTEVPRVAEKSTTPTSPEPPWLENSRIVTHTKSSQLDIGSASVEIAPNSSVSVAQQETLTTLTLQAGKLTLDVNEGKPLTVESGEIQIEAIESSFSVQRTQLGTQVEVHRGTLTVVHSKQRFTLRANAQWPIPEESQENGSELLQKEQTKTLQEDGTQTLLEGEAAPKKEDGTEKLQENGVRVKQSATPLRTPHKNTRELYEEGQRLEATSPASAIASYRKVWTVNGPWAAVALFAHARLEHARGHHKRANRLLHRYLKKYPRGANANDANELRKQHSEL